MRRVARHRASVRGIEQGDGRRRLEFGLAVLLEALHHRGAAQRVRRDDETAVASKRPRGPQARLHGGRVLLRSPGRRRRHHDAPVPADGLRRVPAATAFGRDGAAATAPPRRWRRDVFAKRASKGGSPRGPAYVASLPASGRSTAKSSVLQRPQSPGPEPPPGTRSSVGRPSRARRRQRDRASTGARPNASSARRGAARASSRAVPGGGTIRLGLAPWPA